MRRRGFLAAVAAVLTGRRLGRLVPMPQIEFVTRLVRPAYGAPVLTEAMIADFAKMNALRSAHLDTIILASPRMLDYYRLDAKEWT